MKLCEMAQEYRVNVALLELRIKQLQAAQKRARQPEVRYRLKQRAKFLQTLINESRQTVCTTTTTVKKVTRMRTVALSEHTATRLAYRQYLGLLAEDDRGFRQAFRTAFFRAMREQLTPRQYEVLWMIEVEGLSCKQCAERLGISPSAVSRHCSRGKKRLRTLLAYNLELRHQYFS